MIDGSVFPTSLGVNPQESIYGLARLMATRSRRAKNERYFRGDVRVRRGVSDAARFDSRAHAHARVRSSVRIRVGVVGSAFDGQRVGARRRLLRDDVVAARRLDDFAEARRRASRARRVRGDVRGERALARHAHDEARRHLGRCGRHLSRGRSHTRGFDLARHRLDRRFDRRSDQPRIFLSRARFFAHPDLAPRALRARLRPQWVNSRVSSRRAFRANPSA